MPRPSYCPRPTPKWLEIKEKVGEFEAYRLYEDNGQEMPNFVFQTVEEVFDYVKDFSEISVHNNKLYIKTDNDHSQYSANQESVKAQIKEVNKLYNNLLKVEYEPIPQTERNVTSKYNKLGRKTAAMVTINSVALKEHYDIYNTPTTSKYITDQDIKDRDNELRDGQNFEEPEYEQRIDYNLKAVALVQKNLPKIIQWYKQIGNNDTFWSKLQKDLQIPKDQLDLLRNSEGNTIEEKIVSFAATYSYTVEVKTAKTSGIIKNEFNPEAEDTQNFEYNNSIYKAKRIDWDKVHYFKDGNKISEQEYKKAFDVSTNNIERNTQHYSNLTVPGGTNYTENEISTPLITPSIKGHAQFSTEQGIGWFRSDEQAGELLSERQSSYKEFKTKWLNQFPQATEQIIKDAYNSLKEDSILSKKEYSKLDIKTRRILEVQSDLFQKGRDKTQLVNKEYNPQDWYIEEDFGNFNITDSNTGQPIKTFNNKEEAQIFINKYKNNDKENQFLQLLNKDSNWVTFFIKSIIQDSAKKGYEKVLFPKGETAAKVEGHQTIADEIQRVDRNIKHVDSQIEDIIKRGYVFAEDKNYIWTEKDREIFSNAPEGVEPNIRRSTNKEDIDKEIKRLQLQKSKFEEEKQNLKSQGIEKLKPIEAFYEIKVSNVLRKINPNIKVITDEYGNQWNEYMITDKDLENFDLQRKQFNDKLTPENRIDFERKKKQLLKVFPSVSQVIEDYDMPQAGIVEPGGNVIRVNPTYWTTDTIGHEFAHILIDSIGGVENPLVKRGIELLKGSNIDLRLRELYKDLYETNQSKYWKEVLAQAIGEETAIIFANEKDHSDFYNWLQRLFAKIKQVLGLDSNAVKQIARMVVHGTSTTSVNVEFNESRVADEMRNRVERESNKPTTVSKLYEQAKLVLDKKIKIYKKRDTKAKIDSFTELLNKINTLDKDPIEALKLFKDFATNQTDAIYARYTHIVSEGSTFTLEELSKWKDYVSAFNMLEDMVKFALYIQDETLQNPEFAKAREVLTPKVIEDLNKVINKKDTIIKVYEEEGLKLIANELLGNSHHVEAEFRDLFEREYNKLSIKEKSEKTKQEYIDYWMGENDSNIKELTRNNLERELITASQDVSTITRWIDNVLDSSDVVVSTVASAVATADFMRRQETLAIKDELLVKLRALENYFGPSKIVSNPQKLYDFMLEKDEQGRPTSYLVSRYKSGMWEEYERYKKTLTDQGKSFDFVQEALKVWLNKNAPLNTTDFNKAKSIFLESLVKEGILTQVELNKLLVAEYNYRTKSKHYKIDEIWDNTDAIDKYNHWLGENIRSYREPINKWINTQYFDLVKLASNNKNISNLDYAELEKLLKENETKDPRVDFYNFITNTTLDLQSSIPFSSRLHFKLPGVVKDTGERIVSGSSTTKEVLFHSLTNEFRVLDDESERGETALTDESGALRHFIPIYYTNNLGARFARQFDKMFEKDIELLEIKYKDDYILAKRGDPKFMLLREYTKNRYIQEMGNKEQSYDIGGIYYKYFSSTINYKHKQQILPKVEMAKYLLANRDVKVMKRGKPVLDTQGRPTVIKGSESEIAHQFNDWIEQVFYGLKENDLGTWGKVDIAKAVNKLGRYTSLNMLGLNFIQGFANINVGSATQWMEAVGGEHFTPKDMLKARGVYLKNSVGMLGDFGKRQPSNIINQLNEIFDILNEYDDAKFRKNSKFRQLMTISTSFFTSHVGEHWMQTQTLLAMLNHKEALDSNGNSLGTMLDCLQSKNGKVVFESKDGIKVANFNEDQRSLFEQLVRRKLSSMHGEYTELGRIAIQRNALLNQVLMFRKFIVPGVKRRYGRKHVNNLMRETVEGNYRTTMRFFKQLFKEMHIFHWNLMSEDWNNLLDKEKANIRKTSVELAFMTAAIILSAVLINMKEEDDDDDWLLSFMAYQALRFKAEMWFFSNPLQTMKILRSPAASMSMVENTLKLFGQLLPPDFAGFETYERGPMKGKLKIYKTLNDLTPGIKQVYRIQYPDQLLNWLK